MNLAERDGYVITKLTAFAAAGMTQRQAVQELLRVSGFNNLVLPGHDSAALDADITGVQAAAAELTVPGVRATVAANPLVGKLAGHPLPRGADQRTVWQIRALAAGA